jgi:hypothetical protein
MMQIQPLSLPVVVTRPILRRQFVFSLRAVHAALEILASFLAAVLQVVLVAALSELHFADLISGLGQHDVLLFVAFWRTLRLVESGKGFATVGDLTGRCPFELGRHVRNRAAIL